MSLLDRIGKPPKTEQTPMPNLPTEEKPDGVYASVLVHFETDEDVEDFSRLIGQTIHPKARVVWYPVAREAEMPGGLLSRIEKGGSG